MCGEPNVNLKAIHSTLCHQPTSDKKTPRHYTKYQQWTTTLQCIDISRLDFYGTD